MENEDDNSNFLGVLVHWVTAQQEWVAFPVQ
jgi:hypothetical protein